MALRKKLLLGSASSGRKAVMVMLGIPFDALSSNVDEEKPSKSRNKRIEARRIAQVNARKKKEALENRIRLQGSSDAYLGLLTLDTVVWVPPGYILGKPGDVNDGEEYLRLLSGKTHYVYSAFSYTVITDGGFESPIEGFDYAKVTFRNIPEVLMKKYLATGAYKDRAGGYAVQGEGLVLVSSVKGDFYTVVGIPVYKWLTAVEKLNPFHYSLLIDAILRL